MASTCRRQRPRRIGIVTAVTAALLLASANAETFVRRGTDDDFVARPAPESPALHGVSGPTRELQTSSTSAGSGSGPAAPTPSRIKKPLITIAYDPSEGTYQNVGTVAPEKEQTFFGLFKTKNVYRYAGMGIPVAFLLYKLLMACWFCTAGRRKFAREDREHEQKMLMEREEMERAAAVAAAQAQALAAKEAELAAMPPMAKGGNPGGMRGSLSKDSRAFTKGNVTSNFWVEEELQAWRLDFQQLKLNKCLTTTPNQKRHGGGRNSTSSTGPAAGEVWLATYYAMDSENNQRMVALKWISPKLANTEVQQEKLKEEIKRQAKLRHPNVAAFIGIAWSPETNLVAVTEYMPRGDLRQWLHRTAPKEAGRWTPAKVKMLLDVTNALVYLHSFQPQLIHGNCNSRNVLLNERMEAKLSDFGAPKDYLSEREINAYKEVGSGRWISPEALIGREGAEHVSDAMDVYSLGILMVEMDSHQLPFANLMQADRSQLPEIDVLQLISNGALTPTLSNTCHPKIQNLVLACTAYDPQKRPSSREISRVLQDVHMEISGRA